MLCPHVFVSVNSLSLLTFHMPSRFSQSYLIFFLSCFSGRGSYSLPIKELFPVILTALLWAFFSSDFIFLDGQNPNHTYYSRSQEYHGFKKWRDNSILFSIPSLVVLSICFTFCKCYKVLSWHFDNTIIISRTHSCVATDSLELINIYVKLGLFFSSAPL